MFKPPSTLTISVVLVFWHLPLVLTSSFPSFRLSLRWQTWTRKLPFLCGSDPVRFYTNASRPLRLDGLANDMSKIMNACHSFDLVVFQIGSKWMLPLPETPLLEKLILNWHTGLKAVSWDEGARVGCKRWHAARQSPLFCLEWGHCELTAQGSDFLSNKQIKPQICCRCTLTGEIHFQSDIQAGRTGNHNELFPRRSLCAGATSPRCLPGSWNNYNSCSRVLSLERRALAEMTGDVGVIFSGECCWKSLWCGWMGWWPG